MVLALIAVAALVAFVAFRNPPCVCGWDMAPDCPEWKHRSTGGCMEHPWCLDHRGVPEFKEKEGTP